MSLPTPYYDDGHGIQIFLGDCREILPHLPKVDLVLTDPPYGIDGGRGAINLGRGKGNYGEAFTDSPEYISSIVKAVIEACILKSYGVVVTPGNSNFMLYPQPDSFGCFYQPAAVGMQVWGNLDSQPIFYYGKNPSLKNLGKPLSFVLTEQPEKNGHPCVKPLGIWKKIMVACSLAGQTILDPFMGSGTTLRAAKDLGRKCIGIEIEEKYCEIAVRRLQQEVLPLG